MSMPQWAHTTSDSFSVSSVLLIAIYLLILLCCAPEGDHNGDGDNGTTLRLCSMFMFSLEERRECKYIDKSTKNYHTTTIYSLST